MDWKFCPNCGHKLESTWKFCAGCSQQITNAMPLAPYIWPVPIYPTYPTPYQAPVIWGTTCGLIGGDDSRTSTSGGSMQDCGSSLTSAVVQ
jgi:hypothetical protein